VGQVPRPEADARDDFSLVVEGAALNARDEILERIRSVDRGAPVPVPRAYRHAGSSSAEERTLRFCERVADYRAEVRRIAADTVGAETAAVFAERGARRIAVPRGLPAPWRPAGVEVVEDHGLSSRYLDRLDGTLTGCTVAIAQTGTIVLSGGPLEGRRALSLVPDLHVCVVPEAAIVELVPEVMAVLAPLVTRERRPLTFVSGPSATSDIELSRVEGVHGPRNLVVLVVRGAA
jgi:L-lactate dehydrogenase complex protein LldG